MSSSSPTIFYKIYFSTIYFLLCSPFHISFRGEHFVKKTWWPQKLICAFMTIISIYWILQDLGPSKYTPNAPKNPTVLFVTACKLINAVGLLATLKLIWCNQEKFILILNHLGKKFGNCIQSQNSKRYNLECIFSAKLLVPCTCGLYTGIALFDALAGRGLGVYQKSHEARLNSTAEYFPLQLDKIISVILKVGWYHRRILGAHMEAFLLFTACTMWTSVNHLVYFLDNNSTKENSKQDFIFVGKHIIIEMECRHKGWLSIYSQYLSLKQLTNMINPIIGFSVTCSLAAGVLEYAIGLDEVFVEKTASQLANSAGIIFYFFNKITFIMISADVCRKISGFKEWLSVDENRVGIPPDQLSFIVNELDTNVVAVKGSNIFPVTYALAANVSEYLK